MNHMPETAGPKQENSEEPGSPGSLIVFDLRKLTHFREDKPHVQVLSDIGDARVALFTFKAGQ